MGKGGKGSYEKRKKQKQLACLCLTVILVIIIIILAVLYFAVYRPKDPQVQVPTMQLLSLYPIGYSELAITTTNLTLNLQVSIYNPNRGTFIVQDGGVASLFYNNVQVGLTTIPTGTIPAQASSSVSVPLTVHGSVPLEGNYLITDMADGILQVSTTVTVVGKVTTLNVFTHHADVASKCAVNVSYNTRAIESYTCQRSFSLVS